MAATAATIVNSGPIANALWEQMSKQYASVDPSKQANFITFLAKCNLTGGGGQVTTKEFNTHFYDQWGDLFKAKNKEKVCIEALNKVEAFVTGGAGLFTIEVTITISDSFSNNQGLQRQWMYSPQQERNDQKEAAGQSGDKKDKGQQP